MENTRAAGSIINIFGIRFVCGEYAQARLRLLGSAFMVVPAAPALIALESDPAYKQAVTGSDFAIFDSGLLVLLLRIFKGVYVSKLSGLEFLRKFLQEDFLKQSGSLFLINPNADEQSANHRFLCSLGVPLTESDHYLAPMYGKGDISDPVLIKILNSRRPRFIMINLGGGVQEKLGYYLKTHLEYRIAIICTGAAIAFLTGMQAAIPECVDRFYLGWLMRCLWKPRVYIPRYLAAVKLIPMVWKARVTKSD